MYDQNGSLGLTSAKMLEILQTGISRMGYLGYDSCGVCVGSSANDSGTNPPVIIKTDGVAEDLAGKVKASLDAGTLAGSMQLTRQVGHIKKCWRVGVPTQNNHIKSARDGGGKASCQIQIQVRSA